MRRTVTLYALSLALMLAARPATGQVKIGSGTPTPDPSSVLDISSTEKGMLVPRLTQGQRDSVVSPAEGLLVYQTTGDAGFYYYSAGWQKLSGMANTALSNLAAPLAINADLRPVPTNLYSLGTDTTVWKNLYLGGDAFVGGARFPSRRGTNNFLGGAGNVAVAGSYNTATGNSALMTNVNGNWNTANGYAAIMNANNAYSNTGIGFQALLANTTGSYNTATGVLALGANTTGISNSAMGVAALSNLTGGSYNIAMGYFSGANLPSGNYNTYLGSYADGPSGVTLSNATAIGYNTVVSASNAVRIGNSSVTSIGGQVNWTAFSDGRFKRNVRENVPGLAFINQLRPVTYTVDIDGIEKRRWPAATAVKNDVVGARPALSPTELEARQAQSKEVITGFIAQEVEAAAQGLGYRFSGVDAPKNEHDIYGLRYGDFVVPLVKAVQELSAENKELKAELSQLREQVAELANDKGK